MESKDLVKLRSYRKKLLRLLDDHKGVDDFIFFGSFVKSKASPGDIDLAVLSKKRLAVELKDVIRELIPGVDIELVPDIYSPLFPILMREGFSIRRDCFLFELYNLRPVVLYSYSLKSLDAVKKVQFSRGVKRLVEDVGAEYISRSVVLVPMDKKELFEELLATWNIQYESRSYELFPLLRKEEF